MFIKALEAIVSDGLLLRYLKDSQENRVSADFKYKYCIEVSPEKAPGAMNVMKLYDRSLMK